jgi:integrase
VRPAEPRLAKFLRPLFLDDESSLTVARVREHLEALSPELSPSTINKVRNVGRRSIQRAQSERRWTAPNPFQLVERQKEPELEYERLTLAELERIQAHLPERRRREFRLVLHLGLRNGELFALRKDDIDFVRGSITIRRSHDRNTTKTGTTRVLPLLPAIAQDLAEAIQSSPSALVFPKEDGTLQRHDTKMTRIIRTAMRAAGVGYKCITYHCRHCGTKEELPPPVERRFCRACARKLLAVPQVIKFRWYDLRHMAATLHARAGANDLILTRVMGHTTKGFSTTHRVYVHFEVSDLLRELSRWSLRRFEPTPKQEPLVR